MKISTKLALPNASNMAICLVEGLLTFNFFTKIKVGDVVVADEVPHTFGGIPDVVS